MRTLVNSSFVVTAAAGANLYVRSVRANWSTVGVTAALAYSIDHNFIFGPYWLRLTRSSATGLPPQVRDCAVACRLCCDDRRSTCSASRVDSVATASCWLSVCPLV
jgi:hypothetical protein